MRTLRLCLATVFFSVVIGGLSGGAAQTVLADPPALRFGGPTAVLACGASSIRLSYKAIHDYTPGGGLTFGSQGSIGGALVFAEGGFGEYGGAPATLNLTFTFNFGAAQPNATYTYKHVWTTFQNGAVIFRSSLSGTCVWNGVSFTPGDSSIGTEDLSASPDVYSGPVLPPPSARNLVLVKTDTPILDTAGGKPTGQILEACKTVFIVLTSTGGKYGNAFVIGGWIDLSKTVDVPEDYGQPGGSPVIAACVGK